MTHIEVNIHIREAIRQAGREQVVRHFSTRMQEAPVWCEKNESELYQNIQKHQTYSTEKPWQKKWLFFLIYFRISSVTDCRAHFSS